MKISADQVRQDLKITYDSTNCGYPITLKGVVIGHMVRYGKYVGMNRSRVKDVVGSRMSYPFRNMDLEAADRNSLLNKLAPKIARVIKMTAPQDAIYDELLISAMTVTTPVAPTV